MSSDCTSTCSICPRRYPVILGDGPTPCRVMGIGERPGKDENRVGRVFVGQSGREQNELYFPLAGLERCEVYMTNAVKCGEDNNKTPTAKEIAGCSEHWLPDELMAANPEVVVLLGASACGVVEGGLDLEVEHGIPRRGRIYGWEGWVVGMYHPAYGLRDTSAMTMLLDDWKGLERWLRSGCRDWNWPVDAYPNPDYRLARTEQEVYDNWCEWEWHDPAIRLMGGDSERHGSQKFSIQLSGREGQSLMVLWEDLEAMRTLSYYLNMKLDRGMEVAFHNAEADLEPFLACLNLTRDHPITKFAHRDTQQEIYHLSYFQRQGLKMLGYRLFGVRMKSWEDVCGPPSKEALHRWLMQADEELRANHFLLEHKQLKTKVKEIRKEHPDVACITRVIRYMLTGSDEYDPWSRVAGLELRAALESKLGKVPIMGIGHVGLEEAVEYGCKDADMELRLALELEKRRREIVQREWAVAEEDRDELYRERAEEVTTSLA